uniref:Uncharacterized protein n=1 Tax=Alexandrium monilatum TaxID=311494 RepID=A0A7S4W9D9_9DINO
MRCAPVLAAVFGLCAWQPPFAWASGSSEQRQQGSAMHPRGVHRGRRHHHKEPMLTYRRTSHSLAVTVPIPPDVEEVDNPFRHRHSGKFKVDEWFTEVAESMDFEGESDVPWWWFVAVRKDKASGHGDIPWDQLKEKFNYQMTASDKKLYVSALKRSSGEYLDFGIDDPKVQTVGVDGAKEVFFRAVPQGWCDNRTHPPRASFLPRILPNVADGECVLELCGLDPATEYVLMLFNISNATSLPKAAPKPQKAEAATAREYWELRVMKLALEVMCVMAMLLAVAWSFREDCLKSQQSTQYSTVALIGNEDQTGFHLVKVRNQFLHIIRDMLISMTMFLPIIGPLGLILASDVVVGARVLKVKRSREEYIQSSDEQKMGTLWQLIKDIWNVVVNVIIIPFNMYTVQILWATYCHSWYSYFGLDLFQDVSYSGLQRNGCQWQEVSGLELVGWVPGIVLSTLLLAIELQSDRTSAMLEKHRKRAETNLNSLAKGKELWMKLSKMDSWLFGRTDAVKDLLVRRVLRLTLSTVFGLLPHLWMCLRHSVRFWNSNMMWVTLVYVVNIAGVSCRFLQLNDRIYHLYKTNCTELTFFQALSWQEDQTTAIYDPFATRSLHVMEARKRLRENIPRIACLRLEEPEDSKIWWHLREVVFIQMKDGRILMEMTVLLSIYFSLVLGLSSLVVMMSLKEITSTTIVTAVVLVVLLRFTYRALTCARDINSMSAEHTTLLHNIVAEMNMPLRPVMPLDSHLQQERFLLQVATLIEKQPPPETVASFAVTPQLFSLVVGTLGLITAVSVYNLLNGLVHMKA